MTSDFMTIYKLIILFILDKVDFPLTNARLTTIILEKGYTTFFTLQQALNELKNASLIQVTIIRNSSYFVITEEGRETLTFFNQEIGSAIKKEIIEYLKENQYSLREEVSAYSNYYEEKKGEYITHCYIQEKNQKIFELTLSVTSEEEAISICNHWREKSQPIYAFLMKELL